jgi:hypothetical protein
MVKMMLVWFAAAWYAEGSQKKRLSDKSRPRPLEDWKKKTYSVY